MSTFSRIRALNMAWIVYAASLFFVNAMAIQCKSGFTWYSTGNTYGTCYGYCYKFVTTCETWPGARDKCKAEGGDLIVLKTAKEENDFREILKQKHDEGAATCGYWRGVWVGANDIETEGSFKWVDGTTANINQWAPKDPNNYAGGEDCVFISPASGWKFFDAKCEKDGHKSAYLCAIQF